MIFFKGDIEDFGGFYNVVFIVEFEGELEVLGEKKGYYDNN